MTMKDRLSQLSDFQQKFYKETANITDKKALQDKYLNDAPTAKGSKEEAKQEQAFWKLMEDRLKQGR